MCQPELKTRADEGIDVVLGCHGFGGERYRRRPELCRLFARGACRHRGASAAEPE
jgi:hypothetical protein